jgi:hypothetical protein
VQVSTPTPHAEHAPDPSSVSVAPALVRGAIAVPRGAHVSVDGAPRPPDASGAVVLEGEPGTTFRVDVELAGQRRATSVVLSRDGRATPDRVELPARVTATTEPAKPAPGPPAAPPALVPKDEF